MALAKLLTVGNLVDAVLLLLIIGSWILMIRVRRSASRQNQETEKKVAALKKYQSELYEDLEGEYESLKETVFERTKSLTQRLNELSKKLDLLRQRQEAAVAELEGKVEPIRASLDENFSKVNRSQDSLRRVIRENEKEMKRMAADLNGFVNQIKKMKDCIRERTIDLEL